MTPPPDLRPAFSIPSQEIREPVPFSRELLTKLPISEPLFKTFEERSRAHEEAFLATLMTRQGGDATGLVPNLGAFHGPDDVKEVLLRITQPHVTSLLALPEQEKHNIIQVLQGAFSTPQALITVDTIFGKIVQELQGYRTQTSRNMRERAYQALGSPPFITYTPVWMNKRLVSLQQMYNVPPLSSESQEIVRRITPDVFKRATGDFIFPPLSLEGFLRNAGKVGHPMAREIAQYCVHLVELQERYQQQDDLAKAAMQAYCGSHA